MTELHAAELGVVDLDGIERLGVDVHVRRGGTNLIGVTPGWRVEANTFDGPPAELRRSLIVRQSVINRVSKALHRVCGEAQPRSVRCAGCSER